MGDRDLARLGPAGGEFALSEVQPRYRLVQCPHDQSQGGRPGLWFILHTDAGDACHRGVGYASREEALETARLQAWLEAALGIYAAEVAQTAQAAGSRRPQGTRRPAPRR